MYPRVHAGNCAPACTPENCVPVCPDAADGPFFNKYGATDRSVWFNADYLLWWAKKGPLPVPLVTYGSDADAFSSGRSRATSKT